MRLLFILIAHLLVTLPRLARPGGVRAVAAESLAVKHQLLIMKRSQRRSPNLTAWDRVILVLRFNRDFPFDLAFSSSLGMRPIRYQPTSASAAAWRDFMV